jgi:hypothetical protein|eukprot:COSAG06_NODE_5462_length_3466_cov_2.305019_1_plen_49_part_00
MGKDAVQLLVDSGKVAAAAQQSVRNANEHTKCQCYSPPCVSFLPALTY